LSQENNQLNAVTGEPKAPNHSNNDIFKRLLSVDLNSSDSDKLQRTTSIPASNGQTSQPTQSQTQPQRRTLQVKDLFESQMASLSIAPKAPIPQEPNQQNFDDCLLNDVITPAMLNDQSSKSKPNASEPTNTIIQSQKVSQSPIIFSQPQQAQPVLGASAFGQNYLPTIVSNTDRSGAIQSLTMEQLKQTLIYLLQNDADFLHSIHNAYTASVNRK